MYLSVNGGTTWVDVERGLNYDVLGNPPRVWSKGFGKPLSVSFDPYNPNVMFFSDFWGTFRSDDKGLTWRERITGAPNTVGTEIVEGSDGSLYAATMDNGLMKSTAGGVSWQLLKKFPDTIGSAEGITIDPSNSQRIAVSTVKWDDYAGSVFRIAV